eukprot:TRINITY_DN7882_c0_g2_i1.p1 TRINITY_DN7882_c0_g2~~TRINITY_DN7882_c0_g2_i1.p1  ORF type:complete len:113 (-),score=10.05 TRINITY_DN7882_c0_g2_i1:328-666(-)
MCRTVLFFFFFNVRVTAEIYTILFVGSVRCVQETVFIDFIQKLSYFHIIEFNQFYFKFSQMFQIILRYLPSQNSAKHYQNQEQFFLFQNSFKLLDFLHQLNTKHSYLLSIPS